SVAADHRVAGIDHFVGLVAHRERLDGPPEYVAVERLCCLRVLGNQLEPHEFSWKRLTIGHGVSPFSPKVERAPPKSTTRPPAIPLPAIAQSCGRRRPALAGAGVAGRPSRGCLESRVADAQGARE